MNIQPPLQGSFLQVSRALVNAEPGQADTDTHPTAASAKSPLRYPGGKSRAVRHIVDFFPPDLDTLVSPFFGGGSVELACAAQGIKVHGYDGFEPLVNFWQVAIEDAVSLARLVYEYHPLTRAKFYALQKRYFKLPDRVERAAAFFVLNRSSYSGTTLSGGMSPGHPRFTASAIERLSDLQVQNLSVKHADFKDSLKAHADDFLYLDPPYANGQRLYGTMGDMHEAFSHEDLAEILTKRNGWVLSYNDCDEVQNLYAGHHIVKPEWTYGMNNNRKASSEVLILSKDFARVL